jgi:hypothetical protein
LLKSLASKGALSSSAAAAAAPAGGGGGAYGQRVEDAVALRDKLLMFDQTMAERSRVFDAQADHYHNTDWLSEEERKVAEAKEEARREAVDKRKREVTVTFDIAGRRILVEKDDNEYDPSLTAGPPGSERMGDAAAEVARLEQEFSGRARIEEGQSEGKRGGREEEEEEEEKGFSASQLSGKAREVFEGLTAQLQRRKTANEEKKKKKTTGGGGGGEKV